MTVERNGKVVREANAEVNLPNLLATVFTTTRRERGEVPFAFGKDGRLYTPTDDDRQEDRIARRRRRRRGRAAGNDRAARLDRRDHGGSERLRPQVRHRAAGRRVAQRAAAGRRAAMPVSVSACIGLALIGIVPLSAG